MQLRTPKLSEVDSIVLLYQSVAKRPGGLARLEQEIDDVYVRTFLEKSLRTGLSIVAESEESLIVGEIHAYSNELFCFSHVLTELTIAIDPTAQGQGVGRMLFQAFMTIVESERPEILRVELIARETNVRAIEFYESLGFVKEGVFVNRIKNQDGTLESDIPMAWVRT